MIGLGLIAGAAGTAALDLYSYGDMLVSARPASSLPSTVVQMLADDVGFEPLAGDHETAANRRSGAGALLGYGVGLGAGIAYAVLRSAARGWLPWPLAGLLLGASTLVLSEGSATKIGATDWATWTPREWAADIIPRTLYGLVTAYVVERYATTATEHAEVEPPVRAVSTVLPESFDEAVVPGRDHEPAPLDRVAIEADREVYPPVG